MTTYKFATPEDLVVLHFDDGICRVSCSIENPEYLAWLAEGNTPEPADPVPNPRIEELKSELAALDIKRIRPTAEGDTDYLTVLNAQAVAIRAELQALL